MHFHAQAVHFPAKRSDHIRGMIRDRKDAVSPFDLHRDSQFLKKCDRLLVGKSIKRAVKKFRIADHRRKQCVHIPGIRNIASAFSGNE